MRRLLFSSLALITAGCDGPPSGGGSEATGAGGTAAEQTGAAGAESSQSAMGTTGTASSGTSISGGGGAGGAGGSATTDGGSGTTTSSSGGPACAPGEATFSSEAVGLVAADSLFQIGGTMTILSASPALLELQAPGGELVDLRWAGPDLTPHFHTGDEVQVEQSDPTNGWSVVIANGMVAAAWDSAGWGTFVEPPPPTPHGGPILWAAAHCSEDNGDCQTTVSDLAASAAGEQIVAKTFETVTLGQHQVHNAGITAVGCMGEASYTLSATVLGPLPAP